MVKLIGVLLIVSSLLSLVAGAFVDWKFGSSTQVTGNVVVNIITQSSVSLSLFDYIGALVFSYSIISFIMGIVFLFRM